MSPNRLGLLKAMEENNLAELHKLIALHKPDKNILNTAARWAIRHGNLKFLQELINLGADINALNSKKIWLAVFLERNNITRFLLSKRCKMPDHGRELLRIAVARGNVIIFNMLVKSGADLSALSSQELRMMIDLTRNTKVKKMVISHLIASELDDEHT